MKLRPRFELSRVYDDDTAEAAIHPVVRLPLDAKVDRRGFLGASLSTAAVLSACGGQVSRPNLGPARSATGGSAARSTPCSGMFAHAAGISAVQAVTDQVLVTGDAAGQMKVWHFQTGELLRTEALGHPIACFAATPDGRTLAVGAGPLVRVWDLLEQDLGQLRQRGDALLEGREVRALTLVPGAQSVVAAYAGEAVPNVVAWDLETGQQRGQAFHSMVQDLAIVPNDSELVVVTASRERFGLRSWALPELDPIAELETELAVEAVDYSPEEGRLVLGHSRGQITVWSPQAITETGPGRGVFRAEDALTQVAFAHGGRSVVAVPQTDNALYVWNPGDKTELRVASSTPIRRVAPLGDSEIVAMIREDEDDVTLLNVTTGNVVGNLATGPKRNWGWDLVADKRGARVAANITDDRLQGEVVVWDVSDLRVVLRVRAGSGQLTFSPLGSLVSMGSSTSELRVVDVDTGGVLPLQGVPDRDTRVHDVAFSADDSWFATTSNDRRLRVWDTTTGELGWSFRTPEGQPYAVRFSPDGAAIAAVIQNGGVSVWSLETGRRLREVGSGRPVLGLEFLADGSELVLLLGPPSGVVYEGVRGSVVQLVEMPSGRVIAEQPVDAEELVVSAMGVAALRDREGAQVQLLDVTALRSAKPRSAPESSARPFEAVRSISVAGGQIVGFNQWEFFLGGIDDTSDFTVERRVASRDLGSDAFLWAGGVFPQERRWVVGDSDGRLHVGNVAEAGAAPTLPCFVDLAALPAELAASTYEEIDADGRTITYALPPGDTGRSAAICTCNSVAGSGPSIEARPRSGWVPSPVPLSIQRAAPSTETRGGGTRRSGASVCTCNQVCTCVPIMQ